MKWIDVKNGLQLESRLSTDISFKTIFWGFKAALLIELLLRLPYCQFSIWRPTVRVDETPIKAIEISISYHESYFPPWQFLSPFGRFNWRKTWKMHLAILELPPVHTCDYHIFRPLGSSFSGNCSRQDVCSQLTKEPTQLHIMIMEFKKKLIRWIKCFFQIRRLCRK